MRRVLLSAAVALFGVAAVTGAGWSIQTLALPLPARAARVASDASRWLAEHRVVIDTFHIDHRRVEGICVSGWFGAGDGRRAEGSLLALSSGGQYLVVGGRVRRVLGFHRRAELRPLAAGVGCGRELEQELLPGERARVRLRSERAYAAGRPAIALRLPDGARSHFTLYVAARTYEPLVAIFHAPRETVTARLYLAQCTPALLVRYGVSAALCPARR